MELGYYTTFTGSKNQGDLLLFSFSVLCPLLTLFSRRLDLAIDSMEQLVFQRLAFHNDRLLLEKGFITYLWMQTSDGDFRKPLEPLSLATTKLYQLLEKPFDAEATYASLIVCPCYHRIPRTINLCSLDVSLLL